MYKNNSGFSAKIKVSIFVQSLVVNRKVNALKSATLLIQNVGFNTELTPTIQTLTIKKMTQKELAELTDEELLEKAKKMKSTSMINATMIGFMVGIIIYSTVKNSLGFFTLIPLFFVYKLINSSKKNKDLEELLKERNLK